MSLTEESMAEEWVAALVKKAVLCVNEKHRHVVVHNHRREINSSPESQRRQTLIVSPAIVPS